MNDLRLLVSDIDGTLVRSDKSLSDGVVAAAKRLTAAGVPMALISARPPSGMLWIAEKLGLSTPMGAFNGGTIVAPDGTILSAARLASDVAKRALSLIDRPDIVVWVFSAGRWHAQRPTGEHDDHERKAANQEPVFGGNFSSLLGAADKIVAVSDDHILLAELEGTVAQALGAEATVIRSQVYYLDITAPAANKGDGITALAAAVGVPLAATAAIGDQRNDMAMFARAGLSIAMGQGPAEVRAVATKVTGSNDDDGVAQAIDAILLSFAQR
jgi:Cof subfamily protein (haloacid dehalogenase superfamily)